MSKRASWREQFGLFIGLAVCSAGGPSCANGTTVEPAGEPAVEPADEPVVEPAVEPVDSSKRLPSLAPNPEGRSLTDEQLDAIVDSKLEDCSPQSGERMSGRIDPASVIPSRHAREFPTSRIAKTLHGMWRGRVVGDDNDVGVDYFWLFDTSRGEGLIVAQRTGRETMDDQKPVANAPKFSYLMCAHEGYVPSKETPQLQEFVKVSNDLEDAPLILQEATGLKVQKGRTTLAEMWQGLIDMKYFSKAPAVAFAGGFFKPLQITSVENPVGPAHISIRWDSVYYGGGTTAIKFKRGVPLRGVEYARFVGTSTRSGDFLVASPGNGQLWKVEAVAGGTYDLGFDSVVLGPLL